MTWKLIAVHWGAVAPFSHVYIYVLMNIQPPYYNCGDSITEAAMVVKNLQMCAALLKTLPGPISLYIYKKNTICICTTMLFNTKM